MARTTLIAYLCLAGICLLWGTTYLVLRIGVMHFPPFLFAAIRQTIAGAVLFALLIGTGRPFPAKEVLYRQMTAGFLMITLGNGLVSWAEVRIPSSIAAIICSIIPVWIILLNLTVNRSEYPNLLIILGVLLGLGGIVLVFGENLEEFAERRYFLGILLTFAATLAWSAGSIQTKKSNAVSDPLMNAALQMLLGGLLSFPISAGVDDWKGIVWSREATFSMIYLIVFGSIIAYAMYAYALTHLPVTITSMYSYVNPLVAVVLGWIVLSEKFTVQTVIAFLVTVSGIYLVNRGYADLKATPSSGGGGTP
jgi:drug/metabolite transporter (DMT)-like permease